MKRVHLIITGDVTGVGYRAWMVRQATKLEVVGWVRNRDQGQVESVAEGSEDKLQALITQCRQGPEVSWVENVTVTWEKATQEFLGFSIQY
jgi:acylphosphatase